MSCNDACVYMDVDGSSDFFREVNRRAAKPYRCFECTDVIAIGDVHQYVSGKYEGDLWSARTCAACAEIRKTFCCGPAMFGELWESIRDQLFPKWNEMTAIDCLAKLESPAAIAKMRAEYAEYQKDRT
jgi:hypothetical protein